MQPFTNFIKIIASMACIGICFLMFGWWALIFVAIGLALELARQQTMRQGQPVQVPSPTATHPSYRSSTVHVVTDTSTWQERVARIEAAREQQPQQ
jgi:hypothetical protein